MPNGFSATVSREVSLNGNVYITILFSVDYSSVDKSDLLNMHRYVMTKTNVK